jgi:excinuclease UvrABC helicase subunit UvrB
MQFITGRITYIGKKEVINKDNNQFSTIIFAIKKKMNKKIRNIAFECYGKLADEIEHFRLDEKIEVEYLIHSNKSKLGRWYTTLHAKSIEKVLAIKKENINQQKLI